MGKGMNIAPVACAAAVALLAATPTQVLAHCDGLDGPVVKAARRALDTRDPALVLIWVQPNDEREIQAAFDQSLAVRQLSPQAKELADRYFFETVVRLHRAGEGAPFTGLEPAGRDLGPAIPAAEEAIIKRVPDPVIQLLTGAIQERVRGEFGQLVAAKGFDPSDVTAGRAYVKAYVEFIHLVERLYEATLTGPHDHFSASGEPARD